MNGRTRTVTEIEEAEELEVDGSLSVAPVAIIRERRAALSSFNLRESEKMSSFFLMKLVE